MEGLSRSLSPLSPVRNEVSSHETVIHNDEVNNHTSGSDISRPKSNCDEGTKKHDVDFIQHDTITNREGKKPVNYSSKHQASMKNDNTVPIKRRQLYPNPEFPSTVPPFVADEIYSNIGKDPVTESSQQETNRNKDELESDLKWSKLAQNIGSNYNYFPSQMVPIFDRRNSKSVLKDNYSIISSRKSTTSSSFSMDDIYDEDEKRRIRNEILSDLGGEWKGDQRLEKVLNFKNANYSFKNEQDEQKWKEYLPRLFEQVYCEKKSEGEDNEKDPNQPDNQDQEGMRSQFETETEKWRKYYENKVTKWKPRFTEFIDNSRRLPLSFRMLILLFSLISLGLAVRIFQNSRSYANEFQRSIPQQASTIMAICVNSIASLYTIYIAQDEFKSAPIGLRNITDKLKLIILDLLFIIFSSANLALAFNARYDNRWVCSSYYPIDLKGKISEVYPSVPHICRKQEALSSFLFILLFSWVCCVIFSLVRIIRRTSTVGN